MVFCRGDGGAVCSVTSTIRRFGEMPGLYMNPSKSVIYLGGVNDEVKRELLQLSGMNEGHFPVRYLGVPMHHRSLQIADYRPLLQKIHNKLNNWTTKKLSYAGHKLLISTVLESFFGFGRQFFIFH